MTRLGHPSLHQLLAARPLLLLILGLLSHGRIFTPLATAASPREHLSLDAGWKFHLGDDWPNALRLDKAGASTGPASDKLFSDVPWRTVNLPHDWAVELPFDPTADQSHGFKALGPGFVTKLVSSRF
jgi:beta-galactosidase